VYPRSPTTRSGRTRLAPAFADLVIEQGWVDEPTLEALLDEVLAWGVRPDAYCAVMGVTALGWVDAATDVAR
jgi:hypothetical protein